MRLLIDTHCWLWYLLEPEKLNPDAQTALREPENEVFFSAASAWEIVVKFALGKLDVPLPPSKYIPDRLRALGHRELPIRQDHVLRIEALPAHHRDPFDRLLVAQAQEEALTLVTADKVLKSYDVPVLWAGLGKS
ncbi:MAG TPA: type II toxin-antitoxin system VapC family toxin [Thermoanaerobaculia bacterium]